MSPLCLRVEPLTGSHVSTVLQDGCRGRAPLPLIYDPFLTVFVRLLRWAAPSPTLGPRLDGACLQDP